MVRNGGGGAGVYNFALEVIENTSTRKRFWGGHVGSSYKHTRIRGTGENIGQGGRPSQETLFNSMQNASGGDVGKWPVVSLLVRKRLLELLGKGLAGVLARSGRGSTKHFSCC